MTEANPQGADLHTAADRIEALETPAVENDAPKDVQDKEAPKEASAESNDEKSELDSSKDADNQSSTDEQSEADNQDQEATDAEQARFESIQQLADALEMPVDDFLGNIKAKVKIAGQEKDVTLAELRDGYQMESDYRRKTAELSETRKAFEAERDSVTQQLVAQYQEAQQLTELVEQSILSEFNSVDWQTLRTADPAEYTAKKQDFNERYAQIQSVKEGLKGQLSEQNKQLEQKKNEQLQKILSEENEKLASAIPEFRDEAKAKVLKDQMKDYLRAFGYSDQDFGNIYDHRQLMIIRDAMNYRNLKDKKTEVKNKVINAPKLVKPGSTQKSSGEKISRELRGRLKKSGRLEDAIDLINI